MESIAGKNSFSIMDVPVPRWYTYYMYIPRTGPRLSLEVRVHSTEASGRLTGYRKSTGKSSLKSKNLTAYGVGYRFCVSRKST